MISNIWAYLLAAIILVPSVVSAQSFVPVTPVLDTQNIRLELLNRVSCEVDDARIVYNDGGYNTVDFSADYTIGEHMIVPIMVQLKNQSGEVVYEEVGETALVSEVLDPERGANQILFSNGDVVSHATFPVHGNTSITIHIAINGVSCTTKTLTVIDDLSCSLDGRVKLLGEEKNTLRFGMNYDSPDDRRVDESDIPYSLWVVYGGDIVARYDGQTFLTEDGRSVAFHDGDVSAEATLLLGENFDKVYIQGKLGGKKCISKELQVVRPLPYLPIDISRIVPGSLLEEVHEVQDASHDRVPNPSVEDGELVPQEQTIVVSPQQVDMSQSACAVVGEGVADSNGNLYLATGLRYANLPDGQFTYQFIAYSMSNTEERYIISGAIDAHERSDGFVPGELLTFIPQGEGDTYVVQGLVNNLVCAPAVFEAPKMNVDDPAGTVLVVSDQNGQELRLTSMRVSPAGATASDQAVVSSENLLNDLIEQEFDLQDVIDDAFESDIYTPTTREISMYIVSGILALMVILLIAIIIYMKKKLPSGQKYN